MANINTIYIRTWNSKYWHNIGQFCNRKTHPGFGVLGYRKYRRGKNRCLECGARIGRVRCIRYAYKDKLVDNIFSENSLFKALKERSK